MLIPTSVPLKINKINNNKNNKNMETEIKKNNYTQYSVNQHVFNPDKFSPPNQWNVRLLNRFSRSNQNVGNITRIVI
jgi:hypothetical protein